MATDRRQFMQLISSGAFAAAFAPTIKRTLAIPAHHRTGTIAEVEHVVFLTGWVGNDGRGDGPVLKLRRLQPSHGRRVHRRGGRVETALPARRFIRVVRRHPPGRR